MPDQHTHRSQDDPPADLRRVIECDADGRFIREVARERAHREGILHKSVHLHLFDWSDVRPRVLVQRRPRSVELYRGLVDVSVSGHPEIDDPKREAIRELDEELGITLPSEAVTFAYQRRRECDADRELTDVFYADVSDITDRIEQKFTRDVDAVYWIDIAMLDHSAIPVDGCEVFNSLRLRFHGRLDRDEFVPGALEEIRTVADLAQLV